MIKIYLLFSLLFLSGCQDDCERYDVIPTYVWNPVLKMMQYQPVYYCAKYKPEAIKDAKQD